MLRQRVVQGLASVGAALVLALPTAVDALASAPSTQLAAAAQNATTAELQFTTYVIGTAVELGTGQFLYTEAHACTEDESDCVVEYHDPEAQLIARKTIDFSTSLNAPNVVMNDLRLDTQLTATPQPQEDLVVDAGFDHYVRSQWDALAAGKRVKFSFQVLGVDTVLTMRASQQAAASCAPSQLCLLVEVNSWLLGLLADPIELTYDRQTRRLLEFRGLSNIKSARGESQQVVISYQYTQDVHNAQETQAVPTEP